MGGQSRRPHWQRLHLDLLLLALSAGLSRRIDINEFSLHNFYKNRLVRCYLGANRGEKRKPNPFTGFDGDDDVHLARFSKTLAGYTGPYPIINTALNLVHGENLAWQERKAESFILTPRYCGFDMGSGRATHAGPASAETAEYAYRPTSGYAYPVPTRRKELKSGIHIDSDSRPVGYGRASVIPSSSRPGIHRLLWQCR